MPTDQTDNPEKGWTPGPWDWSGTPQYEGGGFHCYLLDANGRKIGALWGPNKEKIANAHFICAAPELYEALRNIAAQAGALRAFEFEIREVAGNTNWQCLIDAIAQADAALAKASQS